MLANVTALTSTASSSSTSSSSTPASPVQAPKGYAISGDASGNVLQHDTEAYINEPGTFNIAGALPFRSTTSCR